MEIRIIRSKRRKKTAQAVIKNNEIVISIPHRMTKSEENRVVDRLTGRLLDKKRIDEMNVEENLLNRAGKLNDRYFDGKLVINSVKFVQDRKTTFATCYFKKGEIRVSECLKTAPKWVLDYVLIHEMTHIIHQDHSREFWKTVYRFPLTERARGYLMAMSIEKDDSGYDPDIS
jgi:predicted metal-dependent hydrolase